MSCCSPTPSGRSFVIAVLDDDVDARARRRLQPRARRRLPRPRRAPADQAPAGARPPPHPRVLDDRRRHRPLRPPATVGHESITTTTETYAHLLPDQQRAAADAAGKALGGILRPPVDLGNQETVKSVIE